MTRAGKDYLARVESALAILEAAGHAERGEGELRGVLRLALPAKAAIREVIPRLEPFWLSTRRSEWTLPSMTDARTCA